MKLYLSIGVVCACLAAVSLKACASGLITNLPLVFYADPHALAQAKTLLASGDSKLRPALDQLLVEADESLKLNPPSVMDKQQVPPSGDRHDFISQAPYFWRDTNSSGSHYIHLDGQRNPEAGKDSDSGHFGEVCFNVHTLALAFYFTGNEKYAAKATEFIRVWFLNPDTRMNPNLNYGQGIPGQVEGRPEGIISARGLVMVVDAIGLLAESKSWSAVDRQTMTAWLDQYFNWLSTNGLALREGRAANNHGTFYDTQVAAIAMFLSKTNVAQKLLMKDRHVRIAHQIEPDGRQPHELTRTLSFDYSLFNLRALFDLASLGQNAGVDLWHFETPDKRGILQAMKYMAVYADPQKIWPYKQIKKPKRDDLADLLLRASAVYHNSEIETALNNFSSKNLAKNQLNLLFATSVRSSR